MTIVTRLMCAGIVFAAACGDNSSACGEGTVEADGVCMVAVPPPVTCRDGTVFDEATNACVIDPTACQAGTVLVRGTCQDPTAGLTPDLEEGPEPNGDGVDGEDSATPAGVLTLPTTGAPGLVLHGTIVPRPDRDEDGVPEADVDTFVFDATGPAVLDVTVDGVGGLAGGFVLVGDAAELEDWGRAAINLYGDTARRRLFIPAAGHYKLGIVDARALTLPFAVVGGDDAEYFVTITQQPLTTPTPIEVTGGAATQTGALGPQELAFYAVPLGAGQNELTLTTAFDGEMGGLVVLVGDAVAGAADEMKLGGLGGQDAIVGISGVAEGTMATIVVDHRISGTTTASPFTLDTILPSTLR